MLLTGNGSIAAMGVKQSFISVAAGSPYTFSAWLKGSGNVRMGIGDSSIGPPTASGTITLTSTWAQYTLYWTPATTGQTSFAVTQVGVAAPFSCNIDDVICMAGSLATAVGPSVVTTQAVPAGIANAVAASPFSLVQPSVPCGLATATATAPLAQIVKLVAVPAGVETATQTSSIFENRLSPSTGLATAVGGRSRPFLILPGTKRYLISASISDGVVMTATSRPVLLKVMG